MKVKTQEINLRKLKERLKELKEQLGRTENIDRIMCLREEIEWTEKKLGKQQ